MGLRVGIEGDVLGVGVVLAVGLGVVLVENARSYARFNVVSNSSAMSNTSTRYSDVRHRAARDYTRSDVRSDARSDARGDARSDASVRSCTFIYYMLTIELRDVLLSTGT